MGRVAQNRSARPASSPLGGSSMPTIAIAIAAAAVALLIPQAAAAATAGGLPWESTFQTVANSMTGPVVQYGSVGAIRSEEHTSELQSLMRISYAVFCLKKTKK